jgi:outer membrane protein assembly factor BamD
MVVQSLKAVRGLVAAFALTALGASCGGAAAAGSVEYSVSAKQNYAKGLSKLESQDWIAAAKYFSFIKARFPYSKFATLAELRMADAEYGAGHYLQAIENYKLFMKFHPTHEMVTNGYVSFRIGAAYYRMLPGDFWLLPPSHEKDQSATHDAYRELSTFLRKYSKSAYADKARKMVRNCATRLATHEWYVANFYWNQGKPMGAVLRLRRLVDRYPQVALAPEALYLLGEAYLRVDMAPRARTAWETLIQRHPNHKRAHDARDRLKGISG